MKRRVRAEHQEKVVLHLKRLLQPVHCGVRIAQAGIDDCEGAWGRLPSSSQRFQLAQKSLRLLPPPQPTVHVSEEGKGHGFAGEAESTFEGGNRLRMPILEPRRPAENEVPMKGVREQLDRVPGLGLRLLHGASTEVQPGRRVIREKRNGIELQRVLNFR
jgi:hypothetical protein